MKFKFQDEKSGQITVFYGGIKLGQIWEDQWYKNRWFYSTSKVSAIKYGGRNRNEAAETLKSAYAETRP